MGENMVALPLPMLSAAICAVIAFLLPRLDIGARRAPQFLAALFATFAVQALLLGLRFGYGVDGLVALQRVLPLLTGPLLYLSFIPLCIAPDELRGHALRHLGAAGAVAAVFLALSLREGGLETVTGLDTVIGASYLIYAVLLLRLWRAGPDRLIRARLDMVEPVSRWILWGAAVLLAFLLLDTAIALSFAFDRAGRATTIISGASVVMLALLLALVVALPRFLAARPVRPAAATGDDAESAALEQSAAALLRETRIYLDPGLTVQRLARRLHVSERALSGAVNQTTGLNVSQYVNGFRVAHAADLLRSGDDSVAQVMAQSGFLTRSNFYREFQRVHGQTPAAYRRGG